MKKFVVLLFICVCFTACGKKDVTPQVSPTPDNEQTSIQPENKEEVRVEDKVYDSRQLKGSWNVHYPNLTGDNMDSCNQVIASTLKKMLEEIDLKQEVDITLNYDIKTNTEKVFSVLFTGNYYVKDTAHPMNLSFSVNYDKEKNREMVLADVIEKPDTLVEKCKKAVSKQCEKEFRESFKKLSEDQIREQILEEEHQFYLQDGRLYIRLAIPAGSYYYQYVSCEL